MRGGVAAALVMGVSAVLAGLNAPDNVVLIGAAVAALAGALYTWRTWGDS